MEELYKQNSGIVYHFLYSMCKDEALAEDLTQETFLKAIEGIHRYDGSCKISTWLCQIARHLLYQHWAKTKKEVHAPLDEALVLVSGVATLLAGTEYIQGVNTFALVGVCMVAIWFLGNSMGRLNKMSEKDYIMMGLSVIFMIYSFGMLCYCARVYKNGLLPFGMSERQYGLFMHWQWVIIFALQFIFMVRMIVRIFKQKVDLRGALCITLAGLFVAVDYAVLQHGLMSSIDEFIVLVTVRTVILVVMGMAGAVVMTVVGRDRR